MLGCISEVPMHMSVPLFAGVVAFTLLSVHASLIQSGNIGVSVDESSGFFTVVVDGVNWLRGGQGSVQPVLSKFNAVQRGLLSNYLQSELVISAVLSLFTLNFQLVLLIVTKCSRVFCCLLSSFLILFLIQVCSGVVPIIQ